LPILHLLFELRAERLQVRFQKSDVATHHAEMGNLLSLNPKIHCLDADAEVGGRLSNVKGKLFATKGDIWRPFMARTDLGEVLSHALLYCMF
jgi:hypothetical protein